MSCCMASRQTHSELFNEKLIYEPYFKGKIYLIHFQSSIKTSNIYT